MPPSTPWPTACSPQRTKRWVTTTPLLTLNRWTAESSIIAGLDRFAPITSTEALGSIGTALAVLAFLMFFLALASVGSTGFAP